MGAGQSNIEEMLGGVGDIFDDTPSRADAFLEADALEPRQLRARLVPASDPTPVLDDKRLDERLQRAIALAVTLEPETEAEPLEDAETEEAAKAEEAAEAEVAGEADEEGDEEAEEEAEQEQEQEEQEGTDDETESAGDSDDEPNGAGFTIATCARQMGFEPRRLYPATGETVARALCSGHAIVAVRAEAEDAEALVFRAVEGGEFEVTVFGATGAPRTERVEAHDLRFMYGFWNVRPRHLAPRGDAAGAE